MFFWLLRAGSCSCVNVEWYWSQIQFIKLFRCLFLVWYSILPVLFADACGCTKAISCALHIFWTNVSVTTLSNRVTIGQPIWPTKNLFKKNFQGIEGGKVCRLALTSELVCQIFQIKFLRSSKIFAFLPYKSFDKIGYNLKYYLFDLSVIWVDVWIVNSVIMSHEWYLYLKYITNIANKS